MRVPLPRPNRTCQIKYQIMNNINRTIFLWLDKHYGNLDLSSMNEFVSYYKRDGFIVMSYFPKSGRVIISQENFIQSIFGMSTSEMKPILKSWYEKTYNTYEGFSKK